MFGRTPKASRGAFSLLELMAVVVIIATIALLALPRLVDSTSKANEAVDDANRSQINSAVERWYIEKGSWPELDLDDIAADPNYFPQGIPNNPVDESAYTLNSTTHRVEESGGGK